MKANDYTFGMGCRFSTKAAAGMAKVLGYEHYDGVGFTKSELENLVRLYRRGSLTTGADDDETKELIVAGNTRNLLREAKSDGLRVMAFLGGFCEPNEDPVQLVARGLAALGFDCEVEEDETYLAEDQED